MNRGARDRLARVATSVEAAVERVVVAALRRWAGWSSCVDPYIGHGTSELAHLPARVLLRGAGRRVEARSKPGNGDGDGLRALLANLVSGLSPYLSIDVPGEGVLVQVAGRYVRGVSRREGYVTVDLDLPGLEPGWHPVRWRRTADPDDVVDGRLLVVDPSARLAVLSDIDDTVLHTGLTRVLEALRTSLLTPEHARVAIPGAAALYRCLVAGDGGRAPVFYVSTGAWNQHAVIERFLARQGFPAGPIVMSDWGPGGAWLFRESSVAFKSRTVLDLMAEHPGPRWILVGDSGQHDPEAYAVVARAHPDRVCAIYVREVPPQPPGRTHRVREIAAELADLGVPMLLVRDSVEVAEHAAELGLLAGADVDAMRRSVAPHV